MTRKIITRAIFLLQLCLMAVSFSRGQCPGGYSQAQVNWDNLDFYYNSAGASPYGNYISNAREQSQPFGIGTTWLTIATSSSAIITTTENATHTGDVAAGY